MKFIADNIFDDRMEDRIQKNYFTDIDQSSNHDGMYKDAKRTPITYTKTKYINDCSDNTANEISKVNKNNNSNSCVNFDLTPFDTNYVTCSRNVQYNPANNQSDIRREQSSLQRDNNLSKTSTGAKISVDKETYCRPVNNFYNQEFVYKTMSRNARLQQLLRKIVYVRQREKQQERWNNFINDLKNKHGCAVSEHRNIESPIPQDTVSPDVIDDYYNTRFQWRQSNQCQNLLEDFYGAHNCIHPNDFYKSYENNNRHQTSSYKPRVYEDQPHCYSTSSQVRLLMWNRELGIKNVNANWRTRPPSRYFHGNTIIVDSDRSMGSNGRKHCRRSQFMKYPLVPVNNRAILKSSAIQTESKTILSGNNVNDDIEEETIKQKYERVSKNVDRLKKNIEKSQNNVDSQSLSNIENKLNDLIQSINACLLEIKTNNEFKTRIVCGIAPNVSRSTLTLENIRLSGEKLNKTCLTQFDDILYEELAKSNRVKKDIEDIVNGQSRRPCGVQITFDIPTRERATEVTASLSKARLNVDKTMVVDEVNNPTVRSMTIAVNTDPLGLLALLKISTETVKRILSYMPQINYYSYLPMIQFPQCSRDGGVSHYVCNICGVAFGRPSQLSDHIQEHNLGKSRDCCVCRHVLDVPRHRPRLFSCRYCGQRFTRAYCSQLHEESCAKRLGTRHDVTSSLTLLS